MAAIAEEQQQLKAQLEETKTKLHDAEGERDKNKSELHDIREELERTQSQLDEVLGELEQTHFELHQLKEKPEAQQPEIDASVKEELEQTKSQLPTLQAELGKTKSEFQETKEELERTYSQLDQIMGELEQSNFELHQLKEKGESSKELEKCRVKLQGTRNHHKKTLSQLERTQQALETMKAIYAAHVTNSLVNVLLPTVQAETLDVPIYGKGSLHQKERMASVAEYCMRGWGGDLIEIGCYKGQTTKLLAQVAKKYNRKVIALDPWEIGTQNCNGNEYETFLKNIEPYKDAVEIIRLSSLDEKAIARIKNRQLCFAFVDGLHTYEACLKDIKTVAHCQGIIAVDDLLWSADVERAFQKGAEVMGRSKLHLPLCREGYLVPSA